MMLLHCTTKLLLYLHCVCIVIWWKHSWECRNCKQWSDHSSDQKTDLNIIL